MVVQPIQSISVFVYCFFFTIIIQHKGEGKMKHNLRLLLNVACAVALVFSFACAKKQIKNDQIEAPADTDLNANEFQEITDPALKAIFQDVHFDYDRFVLKADAKKTLTGIASIISWSMFLDCSSRWAVSCSS